MNECKLHESNVIEMDSAFFYDLSSTTQCDGKIQSFDNQNVNKIKATRMTKRERLK